METTLDEKLSFANYNLMHRGMVSTHLAEVSQAATAIQEAMISACWDRVRETPDAESVEAIWTVDRVVENIAGMDRLFAEAGFRFLHALFWLRYDRETDTWYKKIEADEIRRAMNA